MPQRRELPLFASEEEFLDFIVSCQDKTLEELIQASLLPFSDLYRDFQEGRVIIYEDAEMGVPVAESYNARMFLFNSREQIFFLEVGRIYKKDGKPIEIPNNAMYGLYSSSETCEHDEVDRRMSPRLVNPFETLKRMCREEWNIDPERIPHMGAVKRSCEYHRDLHQSSVHAGMWSKKHIYIYWVDEPTQVSSSFRRLLVRKDGSKTLRREVHPMDAVMRRELAGRE